MSQRSSGCSDTNCSRPACSQRQQLIAAFNVTARVYGDAFELWQRKSVAEDMSTYRQTEIVRGHPRPA